MIEPRVERPLNQISSFSEDMRRRGLTPGYRTRSFKIVSASAAIAFKRQLQPGDDVVEIDRTMLADGMPLATSITYLRPQLFERSGIPTIEELDSGSLYERLRRDDIVFAGRDERIEAAMPDRQPVEYVVLHYLAERYSFHVKLIKA